MGSIRPPAVAGTFYSASSEQLGADVAGFLAAAETGTAVPKAIVVPHAGFIYSGSTAARAYVLLKPAAATISRVILLGPCHRVPLSGLALSSAEAFSTPLGNVAIDSQAAQAIADLPQVQVYDDTHAQEHSLEVQLPFLQAVLDDFKVLPLVVGDAAPDTVAEILDILWGGPETLIVISSDLSHFLDYERARSLDASTSRAIESLDPAAIGDDQACGRNPLKGLLALAGRRGLKVKTLGLCNSGDTAGTKDRVVGYGAWAFFEGAEADDFEAKTRALLDEHGKTLLALAKDSINHGLAAGSPAPVNLSDFPSAINEPGACFVTLKKNGQLRGCIGSAQARRPLVADVSDNAFASAFRDHRFSPLMEDELDELDISISVLSPSSPMSLTSEEDLLKQLRPHIDGLIIEDKGMRALFLPSVWSQLPKPEQFLGHLKAKAGMANDHWSPTFKAWRFIAAEISA
jgi:MEMO1 family protein